VSKVIDNTSFVRVTPIILLRGMRLIALNEPLNAQMP